MDWWAPKLGVILEMPTQGRVSRADSATQMAQALEEQYRPLLG